jgi:hypothetical protein
MEAGFDRVTLTFVYSRPLIFLQEGDGKKPARLRPQTPPREHQPNAEQGKHT